MASPVQTFTARINPAQFKALERILDGTDWKPQRVVQAALSKLGRDGLVEIGRQIRTRLALRVGEAKGLVTVKKPSYTNLVLRITMKRRGVDLFRYLSAASKRNKPPKGGLKVTIRRKVSGKYPAGIQQFPHAFVSANLGHRLAVFERQGPKRKMTKGKYKGKLRQPIVRLWGPTPVAIVAFARGDKGPRVVDDVVLKMGEDYSRQVNYQISRALAGK